jgi:hypothetical protein
VENGGRGGGVVYLMAAGSIDVTSTGRINASGAGGLFASQRCGGAGGGSGGLIGFEALAINLAAASVVLAIGGGGSSGNGTSAAQGLLGTEPSVDMPFDAPRTALPGGCNDSTGGGTASITGGAGTVPCGGGGGAGGEGFIRVFGTLDGAGTIRPLPPS